jgi:two-component system sensor histidine kinase MprB
VSLRRRLALLSAAAVAVAVVLASVFVYVLVRDSLRDQVDDDLRRQADQATGRLESAFMRVLPPDATVTADDLRAVVSRVQELETRASEGEEKVEEARPEHGATAAPVPPPDLLGLGPPGEPARQGQIIGAGGERIPAPGTTIEIPISDTDRRLAAEGGEATIEDAQSGDTPLRVLTQPLTDGAALQVAASLRDTEDTLSNLLLILFLVSAGGIALAAALGPVVARAALAPAGDVSDAAEEVARTKDLTRRIEVRGGDELGRLAHSFNEMMAALESSEASQRRLVADASHELRTPLATLRTNIETLGRAEQMDKAERDRLVADVTDELEELTELVADVVELAREPRGAERGETLVLQDVHLEELARDAVERAERRARRLTLVERFEPAVVTGDPERLGRAISNLLDNAAKWSPVGGEVEIEVSPGRVAVRDHGPGFSAEDLPRVFDRFWRSDEARGKHGSGLGLAIVQRVAEEHGGRAVAANAEGGGAIVSIELPAPQPQGSS